MFTALVEENYLTSEGNSYFGNFSFWRSQPLIPLLLGTFRLWGGGGERKNGCICIMRRNGRTFQLGDFLSHETSWLSPSLGRGKKLTLFGELEEEKEKNGKRSVILAIN